MSVVGRAISLVKAFSVTEGGNVVGRKELRGAEMRGAQGGSTDGRIPDFPAWGTTKSEVRLMNNV